MRLKLKIPKYITISKVTFVLSICLMVISFVSFVWTLCTASRLYFDFTNQGWRDFLNYYDAQLKIAGVGIAFFALWMTSARMKQTEDQIRSIVENNRFNNFFKHRDEFVKSLSSQEFMINLARYSGVNLNDLLLSYYGMFFSRSYENFEPKLREAKLKHVKDYLNDLNSERELNYNLTEYVSSGGHSLSMNQPAEFFLETSRTFSYLSENDSHLKNWLSQNLSSHEALNELCHLYYTYRLYMNVISFSGEKLSDFIFPQFVTNFTSFLNRNGIQILILD